MNRYAFATDAPKACYAFCHGCKEHIVKCLCGVIEIKPYQREFMEWIAANNNAILDAHSYHHIAKFAFGAGNESLPLQQ